MTWKCHVEESANGKYDMILGRYLLTSLGLNLKFSGNVMHVGEGPYKWCSAPMVDVNNYDFNIFNGKDS